MQRRERYPWRTLRARSSRCIGELEAYDERIDRLLDRVFDEYGLIVSGWSGEWDAALVAAIERCPTRRFTTYWTVRSEPGERASRLITLRRAVLIEVASADAFFVELEGNVAALRDLAAVHPATPAIAVATAKRFLAEDRHRIRLHDLVHNEVARVEQHTATPPLSGIRDDFLRIIADHEAVSATLAHVMATTGYWATPEQWPLMTGVLDRLGSRWSELVGGATSLISLRDYPLTIALYAAGLGTLAKGDLAMLARLLGHGEVRRQGVRKPLTLAAMVASTLDGDLLQVPGGRRQYTPSSDHLSAVLRDPLRELIPQDARYEELWDRLEYSISLAAADRRQTAGGGGFWSPYGSYAWRNRHRWDEENLYQQIEHEATSAGEEWGFLHGPLFAGSLERFLEVKQAYDAELRRAPLI